MNSKNDIRERKQDIFNVSDGELESVLETYLEQEKKEPPKRTMVNAVTLAGFGFLAIGFIALIQAFLPIGGDITGLLKVMPIFGGILVIAIGLGFFVGERKSKAVIKKKQPFLDDSTKDSTSAKGSEYETASAPQKDSWAHKKKKKLFRSRKDYKIAGVCGGLAQYFGLDSTLVRIAYIASIFLSSGSSLLVYPALMFILPKEPKKD
jgi:phage shock protein C